MRMRLMAPLALLVLAPAVTMAAGRPAAETCVNAGYRMGTAAFDTCVARVGGDDPLAALEGAELTTHGDKKPAKPSEANPLAAMTPTRVTVPGVALPRLDTREEMPASFNTPMTLGVPQAPPGGGGGVGAPPPAPSGPGGWWPTLPTAPTLPNVVAPNVPAWDFGSQ